MALNAFGALLKRNGVTIAEVTEISGPGLSRETLDSTHHQSPAMWGQLIKGIKRAGEVTLTIQYTPTASTHNASTGLLADFANDTTIDTYSLVFPDTGATTWSFPGIVTNFEPSAPHDDKLTGDVTIAVAGQPTLV